MSAGLLAVYSFGPPTELWPYIYYGLLAMRNRGGKFSAYVHDGGGIKRVELRRGEAKSAMGIVAVGCARAGECCEEGDGYVVCKSGVERVEPGGRPARTSYVALTRDGALYVYRSGLWHLAIGAYGFDLAIAATETGAIEVLGGEVRRSLKQGELVVVERSGVRSELGEAPREVCLLDLAYAMRPDGHIDGVPVAELRGEMANLLAPVEGDVVVGVPESGGFYASLLAARSGLPYLPAFVQTLRGRSALLDDMGLRLSLIQLKANPIEALVKGKRVFLVDDSLITGLTLKAISQILRHKAGVREVRVGVVMPPLRSECPYGAKTPPAGVMAANKLDADELRLALEVDELKWPPLEKIRSVLEARGLTPCVACLL